MGKLFLGESEAARAARASVPTAWLRSTWRMLIFLKLIRPVLFAVQHGSNLDFVFVKCVGGDIGSSWNDKLSCSRNATCQTEENSSGDLRLF
jgi:hypothetical protein